MSKKWFVTWSVIWLHAGWANAAELDKKAIKSAISRSLPLLEKASAGAAKQRKCFTCHNLAMPVVAIVAGRKLGFKIDEKNLQRQVAHTVRHLKRGTERYLAGKGQGGAADTAGYALWTLEVSGSKPDKTTAAVTEFLLKFQHESGRWIHSGNRRPPSEASHFSTTYFSLRALAQFGTKKQQDRIAKAQEKAQTWLLESKPKDTEDRVFRLRALDYLDAEDKHVKSAAAELKQQQRKDGGWSQTAKLSSDAYATGTVLVALLRTKQLGKDSAAYRRGVAFLMKSQKKDGSWYVKSRSKPFQTYFESGFPHKKNQFISVSASSWATIALLMGL